MTTRFRLTVLLIVLTLATCLAAPVIAQCDPATDFATEALPMVPAGDPSIELLAVFDPGDGDGERLYAFSDSDELFEYQDGRWTPEPFPFGGFVMAMITWDDGSGAALYVGTWGEPPGGNAGIYKWDGATWSTIALVTGGLGINTLAVHDFNDLDEDTNLVAGGNFSSIGGQSISRVAYWTGSTWAGFTGNVAGVVYGAYSDVIGPIAPGEEPLLFLATASDVAAYNQDTSVAFSAPTPSSALTLTRFGPGSIAFGGIFGIMNHGSASNVDNTVTDLLTWDDGTGEKLYIAGAFDEVPGEGLTGLNGIVAIDLAGNWHVLDSPPPTTFVKSMAVFDEATSAGSSIYLGSSTGTYRWGCERREPTIADPTWSLAATYTLSDAIAAHYNEVNGRLYVGRRNTTYGRKGLYEIDRATNGLSAVWLNDDVAGVEVDDAGNIYVADDFSGPITRVDFGTTNRYTWVSGWHSGDDDPIGITFRPGGAGNGFGAAFMVDRGANGADEVWTWSPDSPEGETVLHADNGTLVNAIDVTADENSVWIVDDPAGDGLIYQVNAAGVLTARPTSEPLTNTRGIANHGPTNELYVLESSPGLRIVRIDKVSGAVVDVITDLLFSGTTAWAGIDFSNDGTIMWVTDGNAGRIYEFTAAFGACCDGIGQCLVKSAEQCAAIGGTYLGDGATCDGASCVGACCSPAGGPCSITSLLICNVIESGVFLGIGSACEDCSQACCLPGSACTLLTPVDCADAGGLMLEDECANIQCDAACCFSDGSCLDLDESYCQALGGIHDGDNLLCANIGACPQPGACCLPNAPCVEVLETTCVAGMAGSFQGESSTCAATSCPFACCIPVIGCTEATTSGCAAINGVSYDETACSEVTCFEACCLDDGSCVDTTTADCATSDGTAQGVLTTCAGVSCPQPGACCVAAVCSLEFEADCDTLGGTFVGGGACSQDLCPASCCLPDGSCDLLNEADCKMVGGTAVGTATCSEIECLVGTCCTLAGGCIITLELDCDLIGGTYGGADSSCLLADCPAPGAVVGEQKISNLSGGLAPTLFAFERFGSSIAALGDVNGDGIMDMAVGTNVNSDGAPELYGSVRVLFLDVDGTVQSEQRITQGQGGFPGTLSNFGGFGSGIAGLGDLDNDGVPDMVVGASSSDSLRGLIWVLFLNSDGTVKAGVEIGDGDHPGLVFSGSDRFGASIALLGDLASDGDIEIAVGASNRSDGGSGRGAVFILSLDSAANIMNVVKISDTTGGLSFDLGNQDAFGSAVAAIGDKNGDGVTDLAVGAPEDDTIDSGVAGGVAGFCGTCNRGAVYILLLNDDGSVAMDQKISDATVNGPTLGDGALFGRSLAGLGDLNGDGVRDLAVGADDSDANAGAVWIVFLDDVDSVRGTGKISSLSGGFMGPLGAGDALGSSVAWLGDLDGDARGDIAIGAAGDNDGMTSAGAVYVVLLDGVSSIDLTPVEFIAAGSSDFEATGDLDTGADPGGAGTQDVVIVLPPDTPGGIGAVQVFLNEGTTMGGAWLGLTPNAAIPVGLEPTGVATGRLDGDEFLDVVVSNSLDDDLTLLINTGDGFASLSPIPDLPVDDEPRAVATGDFNGDGLLDIAVAHAGTAQNVTVYLNNGASPLASGETTFSGLAPVQAGGNPWAIEPEDVNGDRCLDLVVANAGSNTVSLLLDQGAAMFLETHELATGAQPVDVATGDLDDNGFIDIVTANAGDNTLSLFFQENDGSFPFVTTINVGVMPVSVTAADLDGDGDLDLAVVANDPIVGPAVQILQNLGGGIFFPPEPEIVNADPNYVVAVDLDDDGLTDLVTANTDTNPTGGSVTALISSPLTCPGDANEDGETDVDDLVGIIILWGTTDSNADVNGDGIVDVDDLVDIILLWGPCGT